MDVNSKDDVLIKNPKFEPILRALRKVSAAAGESAVKAFLKWVATKTDDYVQARYGSVYGALECAIAKGWTERD